MVEMKTALYDFLHNILKLVLKRKQKSSNYILRVENKNFSRWREQISVTKKGDFALLE